MYTQEEHDVDVEHWEQHRNQLRIMFLAGQTGAGASDPNRLDGVQYKEQDDKLLKLIEGCHKKLRFSRFLWGQRMQARREKTPTKGPKTWGRGHWRKVTEEQARYLRQKGFDVRFLGGKDWEVFE